MPGTYSGSYVEQQISNFINFARCYGAAGFTEHELSEAMAARETAQVQMLDVNGNGGSYPAYAFYYRYLPYLFLCVLCYVMGYILMGFRREACRTGCQRRQYLPADRVWRDFWQQELSRLSSGDSAA